MAYFFSVEEDIIHEIKIKRSRFITHLHYCDTMTAAKEYIQEISREHKTANHNCWAYIVGKNGENTHSSDAGEPAGTAGKPMLNALKKYDVSNIVAVVTRYFGGVKLGVRGLIDAYGQAVEEAIKLKPLQKLIVLSHFMVTTTYEFFEKFKYNLNELDAEIINTDYGTDIDITIQIEEEKADALQNYLEELAGKKKITYKYIML